MDRRRVQRGFSLMEVIFAIAILAIGLVFVAAQFPVGIWAAREVTDAVTSQTQGQSSATMTKVRLQDSERVFFQGLGDYPVLNPTGTNDPFVLTDNSGMVLPLPKPNLRVWDRLNFNFSTLINASCGDIVMDDPQVGLVPVNYWGFFGYALPEPPPAGMLYTHRTVLGPMSTDIPRHLARAEYVGGGVYDPTTPRPLAARNLGHIVQPEVTSAEPEFLNKLFEWGVAVNAVQNLYDQALDRYFLETALERNYAVAWLYRCENRGRGLFRLYTFVVRNPRKEIWYPIQDYDSFDPTTYPDIPVPIGPPSQEEYAYRRFPVLWRVQWPATLDPQLNGINLAAEWGISFPLGVLLMPSPDVAAIPAGNTAPYGGDFYSDLLRAGTYIVDADMPWFPMASPPTGDPEYSSAVVPNSPFCGQVYQIESIELDETASNYLITFDRPLEDAMSRFWCVPPPLDDPTMNPPVFSDLQLVLKVQEEVQAW